MSRLALDPKKHHLQFSFWPMGHAAAYEVPTVRVEPYDSNQAVKDAYNRYVRTGGLCAAAFLPPGAQPEQWFYGGADDPLDPAKWHLTMECWQYPPADDYTLPSLIISPYDSRDHANAAFQDWSKAISGRGGAILSAALVPSADTKTNQALIEIVKRADT